MRAFARVGPRLPGHPFRLGRRWRRLNLEGHWSPNRNTIAICDSVPDERKGQVFCHELVHAILDAMNDPKSKNEVFVDNFASLLHQAWSTIK